MQGAIVTLCRDCNKCKETILQNMCTANMLFLISLTQKCMQLWFLSTALLTLTQAIR